MRCDGDSPSCFVCFHSGQEFFNILLTNCCHLYKEKMKLFLNSFHIIVVLAFSPLHGIFSETMASNIGIPLNQLKGVIL